MPSIPQSLLWISLVVLWLFVLVPMLTSRRDKVRRTSDVALSTRVLNRGRRLAFRRGGPAAGHRHDPDWRSADRDDDADLGETGAFEDFDDRLDQVVEDYDEAVRESRLRVKGTSVMVIEEVTEPVYIDVDVVEENSGALEAAGVQESLFESESDSDSLPGPLPDAPDEPADEPPAPTYEHVEDTAGLEDEEQDSLPPVAPRRSRERRLDLTAAAAVSARKYRFRKRVLTAMTLSMVAGAALAVTVGPGLWWACGGAAAVTVLYLAYLRRQTRIEEQLRRRRQQRMERTRAAMDYVPEWEAGGVDPVSGRLRRPGAAVLDIDDEDPAFEHLDEVVYTRHYDLPRAAGQ